MRNTGVGGVNVEEKRRLAMFRGVIPVKLLYRRTEAHVPCQANPPPKPLGALPRLRTTLRCRSGDRCNEAIAPRSALPQPCASAGATERRDRPVNSVVLNGKDRAPPPRPLSIALFMANATDADPPIAE